MERSRSTKYYAVSPFLSVITQTYKPGTTPHAVCFVSDPDTAPVTTDGPVLEHHADFPERINVEFVKVEDSGHLRMRVWERGTGETLACGTGACAAAVAACLNGLCGRSVAVTLPGGTLQIEWSEEDGHVYLTGPATFVYDGVWLQDDLQKQGRTEKHAQGQSQL